MHVEKNPESVNIPALSKEELMAPLQIETGEETSTYVPALQAESRKEKITSVLVALSMGAMLAYSIVY